MEFDFYLYLLKNLENMKTDFCFYLLKNLDQNMGIDFYFYLLKIFDENMEIDFYLHLTKNLDYLFGAFHFFLMKHLSDKSMRHLLPDNGTEFDFYSFLLAMKFL